MKKENFSVKSLAGSILLAPGLFLLCGHLLWAAAQGSHVLGNADGDSFGLLSPVIWASSVGEQQVLHLLVHTLWPVLLVIAGGILLSNELNPEA
jgi:hypothetical protein